MAAIVPRWEWRTFGTRFGPAEDALGGASGGRVEESDELYFLSPGGGNVKVRDDLMDIKVLREIDADGLEQWMPVLKKAFPLPADDVSTVCESLSVSPPPSSRDAYTLDQLVSELLEPSGVVRTVRVHKRRVRSTFAGCMAETADVVADGRSTRTLAIESEDAAAVLGAISELGLGGYVNTSYPRGLAALVNDEPPRFAVIDVGTNSVKFDVGERGADGAWRAVVDRAEVTRLGEGLEEHGSISSEPLERTIAAIASMVEEAKRNDARVIAAVGTAGLRIASNRDEVVAAIRTRTGVAVEVISGEEESRLAYLAVKAGLGDADGSLVVVDSGGGSTQFTFGRGTSVEERFSVDVGAVRYTELFGLAGAVSPEVLRDALAEISSDLTRIDGRPPPDALVAMGGTVTNITAVQHALAIYDPDVVQGAILDRAEIDRQIELYRSRDADARRAIVGLQPKRAEVILAGACIIRTVMDRLGAQTLTVSDRGLRHGLLIERFGD